MTHQPILLRYGLPALAAGLLVFALISATAHSERQTLSPTIAPARSPFDESVAGLGIVEPNSELIAIGTHLPGIVARVHVEVGQKVRQGAPLFTLDERDIRARLGAAAARLESARVAMADTAQQYARYQSLTDRRVISQDEWDRRRFAAEAAEKAVHEAQAQLNVIHTELERLTVRAPIDATVLRVNVRAGEFAPTGALRDPLLVLGNLEPLHVRVEVDETDAGRFSPDVPAVAHVRGNPEAVARLAFVRAEPLLKPKRTLTGDGNERVDTRVLELIYALQDSGFEVHVGQQVDVFIKSKPIASNGGAL